MNDKIDDDDDFMAVIRILEWNIKCSFQIYFEFHTEVG